MKTCFAIFIIFQIFSNTEKQYKGKNLSYTEFMQVEAHQIQDVLGNRKVLFLERPVNELGELVLKMTLNEMVKRHLPETEEHIYKLYYRLRQEIYVQLKSSDEEKFFSKDVKVRRNNEENTIAMRTLKNSHVYAILQEMVISALVLAK